MAAFNVCSQQINDFLCSQFCPFSAFSASRRGSVARSAARHHTVGQRARAPGRLPLQIDQALDVAEAGRGFEGFDYHLSEALDEEMSDHCSSSSEEDENNEDVS